MPNEIELNQHEPSLSQALIPLFSGIVERDRQPAVWQILMGQTAQVMDYVAVLNLEIVIQESDGYAFLRQLTEDETPQPGGRLISRRPLSARTSLLLVQLRKRMLEHDASSGEARLLISREEIIELMRVFLPVTTDETKINKAIDTAINQAVKLGFLASLKSSADNFEVKPVIKSMIDAEWLDDYQQRIKKHLDDARQSA